MVIIRTQIEAGLILRGQIRSAIKSYCFSRGYELSLEEDAGWLSTTFYIKIICENKDVNIIKAELDEFLQQFNEDEDE